MTSKTILHDNAWKMGKINIANPTWQNALLAFVLATLACTGILLPYLGIPTYLFCALASFIAAFLLAKSWGFVSPLSLGMGLIAVSWLVNGYMKAKGMNTYLSWDELPRVLGYLLLWHALPTIRRPTSMANIFFLSTLCVSLAYLLIFSWKASRVPWDALLYIGVLHLIFFKASPLIEEGLEGLKPPGRFFWVIGLLILWMGIIVKTPDELGLISSRQYSDTISFLGFLFLGLGGYMEKHSLKKPAWPFALEISSILSAFAAGLVALYNTDKLAFIGWVTIGCYVIFMGTAGLIISYQARAQLSEKTLRDWIVRLNALSRFFYADTTLSIEELFSTLQRYLPGLSGLVIFDSLPQKAGTPTEWQQTLMVDAHPIGALFFQSAEKAEAITPILPFLSNRIDQLLLQMRLSQEIATDPLTGVYNRRVLDTLVPNFIARLNKEGRPMAVALIDLDFFKKVNDTYGHHVGDQVLVLLTQTMKQMLREDDLIIRWGGEEFMVFLHGVTTGQAKEIIDRIRQAFSSRQLGPIVSPLTFSAGITGGATPTQNLLTRWINEADTALYQAKTMGRNRIEIFQYATDANSNHHAETAKLKHKTD